MAYGLSLVGLTIALAACGGTTTAGSGTPAAVATPYSSANAVAYAGAATDSLDGSGTFSIAYTQNGSTVNGTWGVVYTNTTEWLNGGSFTGTLSGGTLSGTGTSDTNSECSLDISATLSGTTLTGAYDGLNCTSDSATFTATAFTIPQLGTYSGSVTNSLVPAGGTMSLSLTQYNVYLSGAFSDAFPTATGYNNSNEPAFGVVTGPSSVAYYLLVPGNNGCPLVLTGTLSGAVVSGSYGSQVCSANETGTFDL